MTSNPGSDFPEGVAVVVGGSGGIGRVICRRLAKSGTDVVLTYRNNADGAETAAEGVRAEGRSARIVRLTAQDEGSMKALFTEVAGSTPIHTLINAAGAEFPMRFISKIDASTWREVMDSDVNGFFNLVHYGVPHLRKTGGSIVTLTSAALTKYVTRDILSIAPKAAIDALMTGIAKEEGRFGIRANSVALGVIEAGMFERLQGGELDQRWIDAAIANTSLKRFGSADEVAEVVAFLASSRASYVTGQTIVMDGGYSL